MPNKCSKIPHGRIDAEGLVASKRGLHTLALKHPLARTPLVTTRSYTGRAEIDGMAIDFMPVALYCYVIARQVLAA